MTSLLDIGPLTTDVPVGDNRHVTVSGLSSLVLFELFRDVPELRMLAAQRQLTSENAASLISQIPDAIGKIIAAATGHLGDKQHIAAALSLPAGLQLQFLEAIIPLTFPRGVRSFLDGLFALVPGASGWDQAMKSQEPSSDASQQVTTSATAGTTHQDSSQDGAT